MKRSLYWRPLWALSVMILLMAAACASPPITNVVEPAASNTTISSSASERAASSQVAEVAAASTASEALTALPATATTMPTATIVPSTTPTSIPTETPTTAPTETPAPPALAPFDPALAATLQGILDETVADGYIPGVVLSVSVPGQEPWNGASGIADRNQQTPMTPTTNVRIASISKIFTAVVVLQLVNEGVINLDAPLSTYVPDLVPNGNAITVRNLLNHTTGLYDYLEDRNYASLAYQNPERIFQPRELVAYATQFAPAFRPGSQGNWDYSSTNFVLLGMIVEQVTGNTLAQEMRQRIFEPLELELTVFPPEEQVPETRARGYRRTIDQTNVSMSFAYATANIVSVPDNVRRFIEGLVNGRLLPPEMLDQMFTFVSGKGQYNMPALEYGLGIMRNRLPVGPAPDGQARPPTASTVVGHIGGFGGFRSAVWSAPEGGITIALGVNQAATDPNTLATRVFDAILTHQGR